MGRLPDDLCSWMAGADDESLISVVDWSVSSEGQHECHNLLSDASDIHTYVAKEHSACSLTWATCSVDCCGPPLRAPYLQLCRTAAAGAGKNGSRAATSNFEGEAR